MTTKTQNHRKLVFAFCKKNNLTIVNAGRKVIDIEYPAHVQCVANGWHSLYYPDLKDAEMTMPEVWQNVWFDLCRGVIPCPLDCDCYYDEQKAKEGK